MGALASRRPTQPDPNEEIPLRIYRPEAPPQGAEERPQAIPARGTLVSLAALLRPHQWTKNGICFAGAIFSGHATEPVALVAAAGTFLLFCAGSSAVYVLNDIVDRHRDRRHPKKRFRPVACGAVPVPLASSVAVVLAAAALAGAWLLHPAVFACLALFLANNVAYSLRLKHLTLFDVLCITFGFVLRLMAGIYVLGELPTSWIVLCSFFLACFLGFAKRRAELGSLPPGEWADRRPVLNKYSLEYLDALISGAALMAIMSYALFTTTSGKNPSLVATLPIVYYAIMYYKREVMVRKGGEEPDAMLLKSRRIGLCIVLWLVLYLVIWKGEVHLFR